jgi:hypothetical protein
MQNGLICVPMCPGHDVGRRMKFAPDRGSSSPIRLADVASLRQGSDPAVLATMATLSVIGVIDESRLPQGQRSLQGRR